MSLCLFTLFVLLERELPAVPEPGSAAAETGLPAPIWRYVAGGSLRGQPVPAEGAVYVLAEDWFLHAVSPTGTRLWRYDMGGRVSDLVGTGPDGTIVAATERGMIHAVNPSGKRIWTYSSGARPVTAPAFDGGGTVYFGTSDEVLTSISHIGRLRWRYQAPGGITAGPVAGPDGIIYIGSARGTLYALTPWGDTVWSTTVEGTPTAIMPGPTVVVGTRQGTAYGFSREGGNEWKTRLPAAGGRFAGGSGGSFAWVSSDGSGAFLGADGTIESEFSAPEAGLQAESAVLAPDGTLFIPVSGGSVLVRKKGNREAFIVRDGETAPAARKGTAALSPAGTLYVGRDDWVLSAYATGSPRPAGPYGKFTSVYSTDPPAVKNVSDYGYLMEFARSGYVHLKEAAIADIEKRYGAHAMMDSGGYLKSVLRYLADEALFYTVFKNRTVVNNFPEIRIRAIELLAETAEIRDIPYFSRLLEYEYDPVVRIALVEALGKVGSDPEGKSLFALASVLLGSKAGPADTRLAGAVIDSLEKIRDYHGTIEGARFWEALNRILEGNFSRQVREKALILLKRTRDN